MQKPGFPEEVATMLSTIRRSLTAAVLVAALLAPTAQAASNQFVGEDEHANDTASPMTDLFLMRPFGLIATAFGTALMGPAALFMTVCARPQEIGLPFHYLMVVPGRFTFVDPLGSH
jgi:hypothetical protein